MLAGDIKWFFSLDRFYSTGATLLWLLDSLGVADVAGQLQDGRTPAAVLEEHLAPLGDIESLVAGARAEHDPDNRLPAAAATLAELVLDEPQQDFGGDGEETVSELSDAEIACLEANGIDMDDESDDISQEVSMECVDEATDADDSSG